MWSDGLWVGTVEKRYQPPDPTPAAATAATAPIPAPSPAPAPASTLDAGDRQAPTTSTCVRPRGSGPHSSSSRGRVASSSRTMCAAPPPSPRRPPRSSPPCSAPPRCASTAGPSTPPSKEPHSQPSPRSSTRGAPARAPCADVAWPGLASTQARPADAAAAVAPPVSPPPRARVAAAAHCPPRRASPHPAPSARRHARLRVLIGAAADGLLRADPRAGRLRARHQGRVELDGARHRRLRRLRRAVQRLRALPLRVVLAAARGLLVVPHVRDVRPEDAVGGLHIRNRRCQLQCAACSGVARCRDAPFPPPPRDCTLYKVLRIIYFIWVPYC